MHVLYKNILQQYFVCFVLIQILHYTTCTSNETLPSKQNIKTVPQIPISKMKELAAEVSYNLFRISNYELGVSDMQKLYDSVSFVSVVKDEDKLINHISSRLEEKLRHAFAVLNHSCESIKHHYWSHSVQSIPSTLYPCRHKPLNFMWAVTQKYYEQSEYEVVNLNNDLSLKFNSTEQKLNLLKVFMEHLSSDKPVKIGIKQQYFLSSFDINSNSPSISAHCPPCDDSYLWKLYMSHLEKKPKSVIILIDRSSSLSSRQVRITKAIAKQTISFLDTSDQIGVIAFADDWITMHCIDFCSINTDSSLCSFVPATEENKNLLYRFIDMYSKSDAPANHTLAFEKAFETIELNSPIIQSEIAMILYISRGLLSYLTEAKDVLELIANKMSETSIPVVINTCVVIDESNSVMYEKQFLDDVTKHNYLKYGLDPPFNVTVPPGIMQSVNSTYGLGLTVARFLSVFNYTHSRYKGPVLSLPIWDNFSKDLTVTASLLCSEKHNFGVLGLDMYFSDIAEDVTYYSNNLDYSYSFIISTEETTNFKGITLMHPSYPRPILVFKQPKLVDIIHLEKNFNFSNIRDLILNQKSGSYSQTYHSEVIRYTWKHILKWYIVCIVVKESKRPPQKLDRITLPFDNGGYTPFHHRLDIIRPPSMCRHLNQIATLDAGTLYLSASSFQSPFSYFRESAGASVSRLTLQSYMAYFKDEARILSNPGVREEVRDDFDMFLRMLPFFKERHLHGSLSKYVVRRYVATVNGALHIYPGCILEAGLEPSRRVWYLRAVEHRGKIVLTSPYLDAGGAGYVVTVSQALYEGNVSGLHSPNDPVAAVMAMDLTFGFIYKLLLKLMPFCAQKTVKCFVTDDRGYLIYHPSLIDPNGKGPIEQQHIIHKESFVANDMLNHKNFITKALCNNYADGTIQRYYKFNTSLSEVLTNVLHGEHCVKYQIASLNGTNAFIGIVNYACDVMAKFCPCSVIDRLCLNCNRMEQKECECPCECPLDLHNRTCAMLNISLTRNPVCSLVPEQSYPISTNLFYNIAPDLKPCLPLSCESFTTFETCLGVLGCEWCQIDVDSETPLLDPFCTSLSSCFNGVLGSVSPYGDNPSDTVLSDDIISSYSSVGPVVGSIVAVLFVLALTYYCYRQYTIHSFNRMYLGSGAGNGRSTRMHNIDADDFNEELQNHDNKLLQQIGPNIEPLSPYCISTGYRKPVTAVDSDHGYSTMTPHEESEHLSFALIELESLEDDCNNSDATSTNTSASTSKQACVRNVDPSNTCLPNKHRILAPVTVHRNMETA